MRSSKIAYICSIFSGLILFIIGVYFLIDIGNTPAQANDTENPSSNSNSTIVDNYTGSKNPMNFLVLIKEASGANTDTIIIANYDPSTRQISLLTVPRDTQPHNDASYKINSVFYLGMEKYGKPSENLTPSEIKSKAAEYTAQKISNLTNIPIDYYIYLEIDTIKEIVDKLGGVYFDVPAKLHYIDPSQKLYIDLEKGYQLLDGNKAEQLLRFRKGQGSDHEWKKYYNGSDLKRTEIQVKFLNEILKQKVSLIKLPSLIPIINYTFNNIITNTSLSDTLSLFSAFTKESRPDMNTFKLSGIDRRINGADFFIYNNKIEDTKTRELLSSQEIIDKYFTSSSVLIVPDKTEQYIFEAIVNDNPSNSETDTKQTGKDKP
jgi:LCP family protein required for cell wall assembly